MLLWFANRGTGVVLVALLTLSMALGIVSTVRAGSARWPRFATQALHRNVSLLASAMLIVHFGTAVLDQNAYSDLTWLDVVAPFWGKYAAAHRTALLLGSVAFNLMVAVVITSLVRARLSHRIWRGIHLLTYLSWAAGVLHGVLIGTDAGTVWDVAVTVVSVGVVAASVVVRIATWVHERRLHAEAVAVLDGAP